MNHLIKITLLLCAILVACSDTKQREVDTESTNPEIALEGMWKLQSGIWDNEDGTFLRYPEDSITQGGAAYIIYSKKHYMLIAETPKMEYYRGELMSYSIDGNKLSIVTKHSNMKPHVGMQSEWTFNIENDVLTAENGNNKEVWKRIE